MLSEELRNLAAQLAAMRSAPPADPSRALRTAEEVLRDLAEEAEMLERRPVAAPVVDLAALRRMSAGGAP
jgi:hypothetical protein